MDVDVGEEVGIHECVVGFGVLARDANVFVLFQCLLKGARWEAGERTYHVESNDIFERYFAGLVFLDKNFVDTNGA